MKKTHIIPKALIPENRSFVVRKQIEPYFDPTFHLHPEFQISYVMEGEGNRFVGDSIKPFKANDLVLIGPNLPHVWRNDNAYFEKDSPLSTTVIVIYFHDHFLGETIHEKAEFESIKHLFQRSQCGIEIAGDTQRRVSQLMVELLELKGTDSIIQLLKILNTIALSEECHLITGTHSKSYNTEAETDRMNKVYAFIMKNFHRKIHLEEVASIASMTCTSFSRYFKSRVNQSFSDFLKEIRIEYACKLLKEGKMNIDRIGYECGFQSLTNFNKQFKAVVGKQPHQYRNEYQKVALDAYHHYH
ncbi:AraC family transcriptional regulator [Parapedobacter koreensis]|uniref:Transcriptional regulator, AraC family n=1 Tax=Parapedobacter koreensis TaxID=332977 RepID=A0A1H7RMT4_9SPHI|nr:AraC family transcriptional regulator [Parapedobacter koreensis]SEL61134.1 transcriptional regulator, AraC family [Parapedobacter koreensis]